MTAAFRTSKGTLVGDVTQKATSTAAALELKSTASAIKDKTRSTARSNPISEKLSTLRALKVTTAEVKKLHTTTEPTMVSLMFDQSIGQTPKVSGNDNDRVSASSVTSNLFTKALFSKTMRTEESSTSNAAAIKLPSTFEPISLEEQSIPASEQLNLSAVIGRKMLSVTTKYENRLSSSIHLLSKTSTTQSTGFVTKTTGLPPSLKSLATSTQSTKGVSVTNTQKRDGNMSRKVLLTSVNVSPSTTANLQVTHNPTNDPYKSANGNKNSKVNNNSFGHTWNQASYNDPLATVPGSNDKDKNARTTDTKYSNNLSKLIPSSTVSPKEDNPSTTFKSTLPSMGFGNSPNKLTVILGTNIDHTSKPTTLRMHSAEVNNGNADKLENKMNVSSPHFSNIIMLLGPTATPATGNGGSSIQNANVEVYSYKKFTSSKIPALLPSVQSPQTRNTNDISSSSVLHKEEDKREPTFKSGKVEPWQANFVGMLGTMFEHYKGNSNIIIVPIRIINNSGNVYLMDKNQGSQFSVGETLNNKSKVHTSTKDFTDYENDVTSTALTHPSTVAPTFITEKTTKLSEPEVIEDDEKSITQKKRHHMDEKYGNNDVDSTEFVVRRVPAIHPKTKESPKIGQKGSVMKENIKPVNSVGNLRSSGNSHERYDMYDYDETIRSHRQANARKGVPKTTPRMKTSATEHGRFGDDQIDDDDSADDSEDPTRTVDETVSYKQKFQGRKQPSVMEEEISRPHNRRVPQTNERRAFEDIAAPQLSDEMKSDEI